VKEAVTEYRLDLVNPFDAEIEYFCKCLENREQGYPNVVDGFNVDIVIDTLFRSSEHKASVTIDWRGL